MAGRSGSAAGTWLRVPVHDRGVGLMFQDFALFPHRDVGGNVAFGLRMAGHSEADVRRRVAEVLDLVGLPGIERRRISTLSGGEQQRVALARALAPRPRILLLDEPMGSLDRSLRERLPLELRALFERLGLTVVYVTHDQDEALAVADRTVVLHDGVVEADAATEALWTQPPTAFVARFLGYRNVVARANDGRRDRDAMGTPASGWLRAGRRLSRDGTHRPAATGWCLARGSSRSRAAGFGTGRPDSSCGRRDGAPVSWRSLCRRGRRSGSATRGRAASAANPAHRRRGGRARRAVCDRGSAA